MILLDEAQDCNEVVREIVLSQKMPKFVVGDPNQQIYSFLGGKGILEVFIRQVSFFTEQTWPSGFERRFCFSFD